MAQVIRVRDVKRTRVHEFGPEVLVLRGPYDLFHPDGPVHRHGGLVEWTDGGIPKSGRVVSASMGEVHPGERVLVQLDAAPPKEAPESGREEWWLCEVEAVDGLRGMS